MSSNSLIMKWPILMLLRSIFTCAITKLSGSVIKIVSQIGRWATYAISFKAHVRPSTTGPAAGI